MKPLNHLIHIFWLIFILITCNPPPQEALEERRIELEGTWYTNHWGLYHTIYFQDSTHIALDTHMDTMFFYTYEIQGDTLALYKEHGQLVNYNLILKLSQDSLIFDSLLDKPGIQKYTRARPESHPDLEP